MASASVAAARKAAACASAPTFSAASRCCCARLASVIDPTPLRKQIADILDSLNREDVDTEELMATGYRSSGPQGGRAPVPALGERADVSSMPRAELAALIDQLGTQMHQAATDLHFELAARLRDEIGELKRELRGMDAAGVK